MTQSSRNPLEYLDLSKKETAQSERIILPFYKYLSTTRGSFLPLPPTPWFYNPGFGTATLTAGVLPYASTITGGLGRRCKFLESKLTDSGGVQETAVKRVPTRP